MSGPTLQIVYVESVSDRESFAWYHGETLPDERKREREDILRELGEVVTHAKSDKITEWGRTVRSGDRILAEVDLEQAPGVRNRLTATVVVSARRPGDAWATALAAEVARILGGEGLSVDVDRLAHALTYTGRDLLAAVGRHLPRRERPFPEAAATRILVAAVLLAGAAIAWRRAGRKRRPQRRKEAP